LLGGIHIDFTEVIIKRKSIRKYTDKLVDDEIIKKCLEAARLAPSWTNKQCWHFIVVRDRKKIEKLSSIATFWLKDAPAVIVACGDPSKSGFKNGQHYYLVDVAIALEHLVLAATNEGLGTCWIGAFDEDNVRSLLGIPKEIKVVALTPIGFPDEEEGLFSKSFKMLLKSGKRKALEEIMHMEKW
jgi:nitroreductase